VSYYLTMARISPLEKNVNALMGSSNEECWQSEGFNSSDLSKGTFIVAPSPPLLSVTPSTIPITLSRDSWILPRNPYPSHNIHGHTMEPATFVGIGFTPKCGENLSRDQRKVCIQYSPSVFK
jgi:hypothetical protein